MCSKFRVFLADVRSPFIRQADGDAVPRCDGLGHALVARGGKFFLEIHDLFDLHQKPAVNLRKIENLLDGEAGAQGVADEEDVFGVGHTQFAADDVARQDVPVAIDFRADAPGFAVAAQATAATRARSPCLQRTKAFLPDFLERVPDGPRFADAFHLRGGRGGQLAGKRCFQPAHAGLNSPEMNIDEKQLSRFALCFKSKLLSFPILGAFGNLGRRGERHIFPVVVSVFLCIVLASCKPKPVADSKDSTSSDSVDFRVFPPAGFKGVFHIEMVTSTTTSGQSKAGDGQFGRWDPDKGFWGRSQTPHGTGGIRSHQKIDVEVLSVNGDEAKFKVLTTADREFFGGATPSSAGFAKNSLWMMTVDRTWKVISSEGQIQLGILFSRPDHVVKVGESWVEKSPSSEEMAEDGSTCTLKEVVSIKGRRMAVVTSEDGAEKVTAWIDLLTGIQAKVTGSAMAKTADGFPASGTISAWFVDAEGNRWAE